MKKNIPKIKLFLLYSLMAMCTIGYGQHHHKKAKNTTTYQNPIINSYLADPNILYQNGWYFFFATGQASDGRFIPIYKSKNLSNWTFVRGAVNNGRITDWNYKHFWAPEVIKIKGKFYLYFTASPEESPQNAGNRIGLAIADNIEGPYTNYGVVIPHGAIDPHPVFDKDGSMYMFYTIENLNANGYKAGQIFVDKMLSPVLVAGKPAPVVTQHNWQEGPFIIQLKNTYLLTYSCGNWRDSSYHVSYASATSITGPYTEQPDTIMKSNNMVKGPGHHSFFKDKRGKNWIVYHGWDTAFTARYPRIDRIFIKQNKITTDGPTYTKQPINR